MRIAILHLLLAAFVSCSTTTPHALDSLQEKPKLNSPDTGRTNQKHADVNKATALVQQLQSEDLSDRERAKKEIRLLARDSAESREHVIRELIRILEDSDPQARLTSSSHYDSWSSAVELLGELKAVEALNTLIACIACNNGIGGLSFNRYPALLAVIRIGPETVPKLTEALTDYRPPTRKYAALALGEIRGSDAKIALEHALNSENDEEVAMSIRAALRNF